MANLLTRKVMENMSRQYRRENGISPTLSSGQGSRGNINEKEEASLLNLIRNNKENCSHKNHKVQGKRLKLDDLIGYKEESNERKPVTSAKISLEELARKQK